MAYQSSFHNDISIWQKLSGLHFSLILFIFAMAGIGFLALYSAAGGNFDPWASRQMMRFAVGMAGFLIIAVIDIRFWYRMAYPLYAVGFVLLIIVEIMGHTGMGAQRWINLGFIQLQPSEFMKIVTVMALARYYHDLPPMMEKTLRPLIPAAIMIFAPVGLVLLQPDLGTSLMIIMAGLSVIFIAGAPLWLSLIHI